MEGLLPMVYRAIKKSRRRSRYECLSSGVAANSFDEAWPLYMTPPPPLRTQKSQRVQEMSSHHRRHRSMGEYAFGMPTHDCNGRRDVHDHGVNKKDGQLVRFRSHRSFGSRMFSCVGAA